MDYQKRVKRWVYLTEEDWNLLGYQADLNYRGIADELSFILHQAAEQIRAARAEEGKNGKE